MLPLATSLLAALLGQTCPTPSPYDPPPCAAAKVPGCLPGYRPQLDQSGRLVYVCNSAPLPAPVQPAPQAVVPTPSPPAVAATPTPPVEERGHVGLVLMPGVSSYPSNHGLDGSKAGAQVALEFRGSEGGARVRLTGEWVSFGKIGELSFKYVFLEGVPFRPWLGIGVGIASINPNPDVRASASGSVGVDLYISRDFFLTSELKGRVFTQGTEGPAHGLAISDWKQLSFHAGMGFYFF
jgi:hypothetical protein